MKESKKWSKWMHSLLEPKIRIIYWLTVNTIFGHYEKKARLRNKMIGTKWLGKNEQRKQEKETQVVPLWQLFFAHLQCLLNIVWVDVFGVNKLIMSFGTLYTRNTKRTFLPHSFIPWRLIIALMYICNIYCFKIKFEFSSSTKTIELQEGSEVSNSTIISA